MEEIDKVYAEDLQTGDVIMHPIGGHTEIVRPQGTRHNTVTVEVDSGEYLDYQYGELVPIYGYMSVEV